jgi:hypothetical protein
MKLKRDRISLLAKGMVAGLHDKRMITTTIPREELIKGLERVALEELMIEDRLNEEVREILKGYESQMKSGTVDYQKMFQMVKTKLVKDRGILL